MKQLHWDSTAIWRAGFNKIKTHVPSSTRMIDLHHWLESLGCELRWDTKSRKLRVIPRGEMKYDEKLDASH